MGLNENLYLRTVGPCFPILDGWDDYYAVAYVFSRCGVEREQMHFAALIPDGPYQHAPYNEAPCELANEPSLAVPRMHFSSDTSLRDVLNRICECSGRTLDIQLTGDGERVTYG